MADDGETADLKTRVTTDTLANSETLIDIAFTPEERAQMLEGVRGRIDDYRAIRNVHLDNAVHPAFYFDPRLPDTRLAKDHQKPRLRMSAQPEVSRPSDLEDVAFYPVTHQAELLRTKQVTSVELTEMYLERIKRYNPHLECVITITADLAMSQAKRADQEIAQGHYRGPLHGIPWGVKDLIAVRNYPTTWGAEPYRDQHLDVDATIVQRLEHAGAVLVAKLVSGELAYGDKWFGGQTKNPWNIAEGSGGSSAGPAASVGGGLVGFAIGTETTGSIVWPALRCGAVGLRPTFGLVSRYGVMSLSWTFDKVGPVARSVEDSAIVLSAIAGPDGYDGNLLGVDFSWSPELDLSKARVGYIASEFEDSSSANDHDHETVSPLKKMGIDLREHKPNDRRTLNVMRDLGFDLVPLELPDADLNSMLIIMAAEAAAAFDELTRSDRDDLLVTQEDSAFANRFREARFIPAAEYIQANRIRLKIMESMAELMQEVDVFLVPQLGGNNLTLTNLTGQPTIGVPNGFTEEGMPTGINFVGGVLREDMLLAVAKAYQGATNFDARRPSMDYSTIG